MPRPPILLLSFAAALIPALALAAPVARTVPVPGTFETVASRGDFDVEVREGSPASVEIVGEPAEADRIQVELKGTELRLSRTPERDSARGVVVKVVVPHFRGLALAGSGKGTAESGSQARDVALAVSGSGSLSWKGSASALDVAVTGSGDLHADGGSTRLTAGGTGSGTMDLAGDTGAASVALSGSGRARLRGKGDSLKVAVSGSGSLDATGFAAKDATVTVAGSGSVALRLAGGTLTARIAGSGDVTWTGEGKLGEVSVAGSGRLRKR